MHCLNKADIMKVLLPLVAALSPAASAATLTIPAFDSGTYTNTGLHDSANRDTLTTLAYAGNQYRGFLLWNIPDLQGYKVTSARLEFQHVIVNYPPSFGGFTDISAANLPYVALTNGGGYGTAVYNDIGSGDWFTADYIEVVPPPPGTSASFDLNANAVNAITAASNSVFGVGMWNNTPFSASSFAFTTSQLYGAENLILEVQPVPLPGALLLLLSGMSLLTVAARKRGTAA